MARGKPADRLGDAERLKLFRERAEQVRNSQLLRDPDYPTMGTSLRIVTRLAANGEMASRLDVHYPAADEGVEGVLTRARPITDNAKDNVYHTKTLQSVRVLMPDAIREGGAFEQIATAWRRFRDDQKAPMYVKASAVPFGWPGLRPDGFPEEGDWFSCRRVARAWLNGHLWHDGSQARASIAHLSSAEQVRHCVLLYAKEAALLIEATDRFLTENGL